MCSAGAPFARVIWITAGPSHRADAYNSPMSWSRKGAAVLLALVVFVTAVPALACLLPVAPTGHACCRAMAADCGMTMRSQVSCCQSSPVDPAAAPAVFSSTEQSAATFATLAPHFVFVLPGSAAVRILAAAEAPPPKFSSGASTSLRI